MRVNVGRKSEIPEGKSKLVQAGDIMVAVFHHAGNFYALDELCPHRAGPLSEGTIEGNAVVCPWHQATFDLTTGKCLKGPSMRRVTSYAVSVEGEELWIETRTRQDSVGES